MKVELRRLTENELELLMNWRMSDEVNRYMTTSPKLTIEGQYKWFEKLKNDKTQIRWVIYIDDIPVGSMYLVDIDYSNKRCESGWFVAEKEYRSLKLAMALQQNMFDYIFYTMGLNRNYGYIIDDNKMLLRLMKLCGDEEEGLLRQHVLKDEIFHDVYVVGITKDLWIQKRKQFNYEKYYIE